MFSKHFRAISRSSCLTCRVTKLRWERGRNEAIWEINIYRQWDVNLRDHTGLSFVLNNYIQARIFSIPAKVGLKALLRPVHLQPECLGFLKHLDVTSNPQLRDVAPIIFNPLKAIFEVLLDAEAVGRSPTCTKLNRKMGLLYIREAGSR